MNGSNFLQGWVALTGSVAMIALILTAFGLMLGIVKPADAIRRVAAILGVIMLLLVLPAVLVSIWASMSIRQQTGVATLLALLGILLWPRQRKSRRRDT